MPMIIGINLVKDGYVHMNANFHRHACVAFGKGRCYFCHSLTGVKLMAVLQGEIRQSVKMVKWSKDQFLFKLCVCALAQRDGINVSAWRRVNTVVRGRDRWPSWEMTRISLDGNCQIISAQNSLIPKVTFKTCWSIVLENKSNFLAFDSRVKADPEKDRSILNIDQLTAASLVFHRYSPKIPQSICLRSHMGRIYQTFLLQS